jgi:cyclic-di-GMP-binding protein
VPAPRLRPGVKNGCGPRPLTTENREGQAVMADASFDIVSKVDRQEADNALNQAAKELSQRFDFRGTDASIAWAGEQGVTISAATEERCKAAIEVFKEKLIKRGISLKALDIADPQASGKIYKASGTLQQGIASDKAKAIVKRIKDEGPRGVQAQIQGDQVRVTGKKRDDLQSVIALLKGADLDIALQFTNYR